MPSAVETQILEVCFWNHVQSKVLFLKKGDAGHLCLLGSKYPVESNEKVITCHKTEHDYVNARVSTYIRVLHQLGFRVPTE